MFCKIKRKNQVTRPSKNTSKPDVSSVSSPHRSSLVVLLLLRQCARFWTNHASNYASRKADVGALPSFAVVCIILATLYLKVGNNINVLEEIVGCVIDLQAVAIIASHEWSCVPQQTSVFREWWFSSYFIVATGSQVFGREVSQCVDSDSVFLGMFWSAIIARACQITPTLCQGHAFTLLNPPF